MTHVTVRERASLGDLTRVGVSVHIRFRPWESSLIGDVRSWSLIQTFGCCRAAERMKMEKDHVVPLSDAAIAL